MGGIILLLAAITATTPLAMDMYLPAMLNIATDLNTSIIEVQNTLSCYLAGFALAMLVFGPIADVFSRRKLAIIGLALFSVCSLALALTSSIEMFYFLRIGQAVGGGAAAVVTPGIVRHLYQKDTANGLSYITMVMMIAPVLAPGIGALIIDVAHWRIIFIVLFVYSISILIAAYFFLPEIEIEIEKEKVESENSWFSTCKANYCRVLKEHKVRPNIIISMCSSMAFFGFITASSFVYMDVYNTTSSTFSLLMAINVLGLIAANFLNSRLVTRVGSAGMLSYATVVALFFSSMLLIVYYLSLELFFVVLCITPLMAALILISVNSEAIILMQFPKQTGTATAVVGSLKFSSAAFAGPLLGLLFDGSALPVAILMFVAVFIIWLCQRYLIMESTHTNIKVA